MDQQRAQVWITSPGDGSQPDLASGAALPWNQPEKRGKLTAGFERFCIPDRSDQRSRGEPADTGHLRDCPARRFLLVPAAYLLLQPIDVLLDPVDPPQLVLQTAHHGGRQGVLEFCHACADLNQPSYASDPEWHTKLVEEAT
jgi:hypothetical protein